MNCLFRVNAIAAAALIFTSPFTSPAALELLQRMLKRDRVYEKRISLDCISYDTEETTDAYFQFVLREIHNANCGGDPETSPAIDRYRVDRRSGRIQQWEAAENKWQPDGRPQTK
jgi:hypothetical protein